jgi:adenylate cyclase
VRSLGIEAFATEAGGTVELVGALVDAGALRRLPDGEFDARDEVVVSTARAMLDAGIRLDDLTWAIGSGQFGLASLGQLFTDAGVRSVRPYGEIAAALGPSAAVLPAVFAAFGLPEPDPADRPRVADIEPVVSFVRLWGAVDPTGEAAVRVARQVGESTRRIADGWLEVWDEVAQPGPANQGAPSVGEHADPVDPTDPGQNPSIGMSALARELVSLVHERQLEASLNGRIIDAIEGVLGRAGRLPARTPRPPAIAFVDLAGFTTLTEQRGDSEAARLAAQLLRLAEAASRPAGGRVLKQLGDGVLLRFPDAAAGVRALLELVPSVVDAGLPAAHAGLAAGPLIVRDGDVFGRTVNLAARLADAAVAGEVLVEEGVVVALPAGLATFEPLGRRPIAGFAEPVATWRLQTANGGSAGS